MRLVRAVKREVESKLGFASLRGMVNRYSIAFLVVNCWFVVGYGQNGANDPTFNPTDVGLRTGIGPNQSVTRSIVLSDGKIVIAGAFRMVDGVVRNRVARLNADGSLDLTFDPGTGANQAILDFAVQPDGKYVIIGYFTSYNGTSRNYIARLNANGSLDTTFDPGTGPNNVAYGLVIQADGKVVIVGNFLTFNGVARVGIARLHVDGSLDSTVDPGAGFLNSWGIGIQPDGKILCGSGVYNGISRPGGTRLNSDGSIDLTFNPALNDLVKIFDPQSSGKIYVVGQFTSHGGTPRKYIARLNSDGSLDTSFDPGTGPDNYILSLKVRPDGRILLGGYFKSFNGTPVNRLVLLNTDGTVDVSFGTGQGFNNSVQSIGIQPDGKIIVGGSFTQIDNVARNYVARLNADRSLDASFGSLGTGSNNYISTIAIQPDGKIVLGGLFSSYNGVTRIGVTRCDANGSVDPSFSLGMGFMHSIDNIISNFNNAFIQALRIQPDGKILVGGIFNHFDNVSHPFLVRLNNSGSIDGSYSLTLDNVVYSMNIQPDGKLIVAGAFLNVNGVGRNRIARINLDGTLDSGFDPGSGPNSLVNSIFFQSDDKVIIGGSFTLVAGVSRASIARLNANGSLDTSFDPGTGFNGTVMSVSVLSDGKILVGGNFTTFNGVARNRVARLQSNGSLDTAFDPGTGPTGFVSVVEGLSNGGVLIGGSFSAVDGTPKNGIALLRQDGSLDATFTGDVEVGGAVADLEVQNGSKVLVAGQFNSFGGAARNNFARTLLDPGSNVAPVITGQEALSTTVNAPITISLSDLVVEDPDNNYPADFSLTIQSGENFTESGGIVTPDLGFTGTLSVPVSVSDGISSSNVFSLQIDVTELNANGIITIYNALSPNGDGLNEILLIENIENLLGTQENMMRVFNRWGDVVFETENYDNTNRVFRGLSINGTALPSGTYYYRIDFKSGTPGLTGFISLRK